MPKTIQTPGTVLKSLLDEYQLTPAKLAQAIGLSTSAVYQISVGKTGISAPAALRFAKYFGQTPAYWLDLQNAADLAEAAKDAKLTTAIKAIVKGKKPTKAASTKTAAAKAAKAKDPGKKPKAVKPGKPAAAKTAKTQAKKTQKAATPKKASTEKKALAQKTAGRPAAAKAPTKTAAPKKAIKPRAKKAVKTVTPPPVPFKPSTILIKKEDTSPTSQSDTEN
jgi:addiction module HigA family antidote